MAHLTEQPAAAEGLDGAGRRLSVALDTVFAVLVAGRDADAAAQLALGLAAGQLVRRRVAVVDLAGDTPTLQRLVTDDDPHGITDVWVAGMPVPLGAVISISHLPIKLAAAALVGVPVLPVPVALVLAAVVAVGISLRWPLMS